MSIWPSCSKTSSFQLIVLLLSTNSFFITQKQWVEKYKNGKSEQKTLPNSALQPCSLLTPFDLWANTLLIPNRPALALVLNAKKRTENKYARELILG
jgi:hypothetical protein